MLYKKALDRAAQQAKGQGNTFLVPQSFERENFLRPLRASLHRQKCVRKKTADVYVYHCISNNRIKKGACPGVFINEMNLLDALADILQEQLDTTLGQYSLSPENLSKEAKEQKKYSGKNCQPETGNPTAAYLPARIV